MTADYLANPYYNIPEKVQKNTRSTGNDLINRILKVAYR